jgi:hypothetical protein
MNDKEGSVPGLVLVTAQHVPRWSLSEITKNSSQAIWSVCCELNLGPPEYKATVLTFTAQDDFFYPTINAMLLLHNYFSCALKHEHFSFRRVSDIQTVNIRSNITGFSLNTLAGA